MKPAIGVFRVLKLALTLKLGSVGIFCGRWPCNKIPLRCLSIAQSPTLLIQELTSLAESPKDITEIRWEWDGIGATWRNDDVIATLAPVVRSLRPSGALPIQSSCCSMDAGGVKLAKAPGWKLARCVSWYVVVELPIVSTCFQTYLDLGLSLHCGILPYQLIECLRYSEIMSVGWCCSTSQIVLFPRQVTACGSYEHALYSQK